jgi:2-polyprenyl-3-methyl-5-hydroxy-6-metoxy-1,4-benzoquinol methylase
MEDSSIRLQFASAFRSREAAAAFERFRRLDVDTLQQWTAIFCALCNSIHTATVRVLDVGCGIGRFSIPFATAPCCQPVKIVAVDHSATMLGALQERLASTTLENIYLLQADVQRMDADTPFDLIFASEILQLIPDTEELIRILISLLAPGGRILIRTPSHKQLRSEGWLACFPSALELDVSRTPDVSILASLLHSSGCTDIREQEIAERYEAGCFDPVAAVKARAFSILRSVSEVEMTVGVKALNDLVERADAETFTTGMTALSARKKT